MIEDSNRVTAFLLDLDGTIALHEGREWYEYERCEEDRVCPVALATVKGMVEQGMACVVLTGRPERYRPQTTSWLRANRVPFSWLCMRENDDNSGNAIFKRAKLQEIRASAPHLDIVAALDDNPKAVAAFRAEGIVTYHVRDYGHDEAHRMRQAITDLSALVDEAHRLRIPAALMQPARNAVDYLKAVHLP